MTVTGDCKGRTIGGAAKGNSIYFPLKDSISTLSSSILGKNCFFLNLGSNYVISLEGTGISYTHSQN